MSPLRSYRESNDLPEVDRFFIPFSPSDHCDTSIGSSDVSRIAKTYATSRRQLNKVEMRAHLDADHYSSPFPPEFPRDSSFVTIILSPQNQTSARQCDPSTGSPSPLRGVALPPLTPRPFFNQNPPELEDFLSMMNSGQANR